jgi:hypothetical protein
MTALLRKKILVCLVLILLLFLSFYATSNMPSSAPSPPKLPRIAAAASVFPAAGHSVQAPPDTSLREFNYQKALRELCALMDKSEHERILLSNTYLEKPEKPLRLANGEYWYGYVVRQVVLNPPTPMDLVNYNTVLSRHNLLDEDKLSINKQMTERYFGFEWEYRIVMSRTPIDMIGNENEEKVELNRTDASHILDGDEDLVSKLSYGGNTSSKSLSYGPAHLSYSALFSSAQLHLTKK